MMIKFYDVAIQYNLRRTWKEFLKLLKNLKIRFHW
jgi:hypothetical protein